MANCHFIRDDTTRSNICRVCGFRTHPTDIPPHKTRRECRPQAGMQAPSIARRVVTYAKSVAQWEASGRPQRTDAEVDYLFDTHCSKCDYFDGGICRHLNCGCSIKRASEDGGGIGVISKGLANKLRMATQVCPDGRWPVKVLAFRVNCSAGDIGERPLPDVSIEVADMNRVSVDAAAQQIRQKRPAVVFVHAFAIRGETVAELGRRFPSTPILQINHSSQAHLLHAREWLRNQSEALDAAAAVPSVWYATPDERNHLGHLTGCPRVVVWPSVYRIADLPPEPPVRSPVVVSLCGRWDAIKAFPPQVLGAAIVAKTIPLRLAIVCRDQAEQLERFARLVGLDAFVRPWSGRDDFRQWVGAEVDVGLQASFSESFNYVALDHLAAGVPVVGSAAIRYLPRQWQAQPDDPDDIAEHLSAAIRHRSLRRQECRKIAERVANDQSLRLRELLATVLRGTT